MTTYIVGESTEEQAEKVGQLYLNSIVTVMSKVWLPYFMACVRHS